MADLSTYLSQRKIMAEGTGFVGFKEAPITFPPTVSLRVS